ncbi:MAG: helix-turn-helix domain-containing protein [Bacteroidales bacterium]|nr:helix-turn-helix domain-containing protein [Bacteroidales bacterium]MCL2133761.1 helix-turn-helix domain-containing protein [Bacteroidales bacterium]
MFKKALFISVFILSTVAAANGQEESIVSGYKDLAPQRLLDTAKDHYNANNYSEALTCYSIIINTVSEKNDNKQIQRVIEALYWSAVIYIDRGDYRSAHDFLMQAMTLSENFNLPAYRANILNGFGRVYLNLNECEMAKQFFVRAKHLLQDSIRFVMVLTNLSIAERRLGNIDSAFLHLNYALQVSRRHEDIRLPFIMDNFAECYRDQQRYDSAFHYHQLALTVAKAQNLIRVESFILYNLGRLFFERGQIDSAEYYTNLANAIAIENNFLQNSADNYLLLSKIAKSKGLQQEALAHFEMYTALNDSISHTAALGYVFQEQHLRNVSKMNQQIERLIIEHRIKEQTNRYRQTVLLIISAVLLLVSGGLIFFVVQNRRLISVRKALVKKNVKIIELIDYLSSAGTDLQSILKIRHNTESCTAGVKDERQNELLTKILTIMEDTATICDTEFSIERLAELAHSNHKYVSQVINSTLGQNFRSFLNGYRIREAQRLFSESDVSKYTIEFIAFKVGFKSRYTFYEVFKDIIGVTPAFYLKSVQANDELR